MPSELNHDTIKAKIVAVLKIQTALFTTTGEVNKLHYLEKGHPQGKADQDSKLPYLFITNSVSNFETIVNLGSVIADMHTALQHTFHYDIIFVVIGKDSRTSEKKLDDFQELILETLEADMRFAGATGNEVDVSYPIRIEHLDSSKLGENKRGRKITLRCIKTTN